MLLTPFFFFFKQIIGHTHEYLLFLSQELNVKHLLYKPTIPCFHFFFSTEEISPYVYVSAHTNTTSYGLLSGSSPDS